MTHPEESSISQRCMGVTKFPTNLYFTYRPPPPPPSSSITSPFLSEIYLVIVLLSGPRYSLWS